MHIQDEHQEWFAEFKKSEEHRAFLEAPVAYFCAEYALDSAFPTYAGGLGVLSGDYVREAARQGFPLLAVGLRYREAQSILSPPGDRAEEKLKKVTDQNNQAVVVSLPLENRMVQIGAWLWQEGAARVYLLDTDLPENDPIDRDITRKLYDDNRDLRLKQEIILGLGGFRMLARLGQHASVYHLNESHSAFIALELVRHEMVHQRTEFLDALGYARKHVIFTNHTLLPEGQELFAEDRVSLFFAQYAEEMGLAGSDISRLGGNGMPGLLSMTTLALHLSSRSNAVSRLHATRARNLWPEEKMETITNGIFVPRWDKVGESSAGKIIERHLQNKRKLLTLVKGKTEQAWGEGDLILAWARRLVEYKQPTLLLDNLPELLRIVKGSPVPVRIIFSGPTAENENGNPYIAKIKKIITEQLQGTAVFVPNYSVEVAEILTAGADVWLNTPLSGFEACGTSGMKAGLNGVLALSTSDGWVNEVAPDDIGWVLKDSRDGKEMLSILEREILPTYLKYQEEGEKSLWAERMRRARNLILNNFSTTRVLREYIEKLYIPTLKQKHAHRV